jgi:hypothetical protein
MCYTVLMTNLPSPTHALAARLAAVYAALPAVEAVALAGSQTTGVADPGSDIDVYVYARAPLSLAERAAASAPALTGAEIGNAFWEPGDEWIDAETHVRVDVILRSPEWLEGQLDRVLRRHEASVGYSTCFWHNVRTSRALFDRSGWFARLQQAVEVPYPEPLRRAIVAKNHPLLRRTLSSYAHQIERAAEHDDPVSVNHRIAALLASYFDILFAVNRLTHPGEKRLLAIAEGQCPLRPPEMRAQVEGLLRAAGPDTLAQIGPLVDGLDEVLRAEHLYPEWPA